MKKLATIFILLFSAVPVITHAQQDTKQPRVNEAAFREKADDDDVLNRLTIGIGTGYGYLFGDTYKPFLTTDTTHSLQLQKLSRGSFVISSVIIFKFANLVVEESTNKLMSLNKDGKVNPKPKFYEHLSVNVALNLLEANAEDISFNKSIDGGLGIGYFLGPNIQLAVFADVMRIRQMKDYYVDNYLGKSIPNGNEVFNALDEDDNNLFYTKTYGGISFKAVFSIGNKK